MKGLIFDLKHFTVHDGPGIRVSVFFKGCPLHCLWCHNPESISPDRELMLLPNRCARCGDCVRACRYRALSQGRGGEVLVERSRCQLCGDCEQACAREAIQVVGREASVSEIMAEVEKDRAFFEQSGGGVTLTGGEPLFQPAFAEALIDELKARGLHVALDTSGFAPEATFLRIAGKCDLILFDLKLMDEEKHREFTGVSNELILNNLRALDSTTSVPVWIRFPLVPGVNDDGNIEKMAGFLKNLKNIKLINVLPYHRGGVDKFHRLGLDDRFKVFETPAEENINRIVDYFKAKGFEARKGG